MNYAEQKEYYTFTLSDKVTKQAVTYGNRYGITVSGDLYTPKNTGNQKLAAIILSGPFANVYFEPGARSNWHTHPAGQILIITDGIGFHQIKGQPRQILHKGDVVKCPPNVEHWHGASPESGLQQLYIVPNTEKGVVNWLKPVTDEE